MFHLTFDFSNNSPLSLMVTMTLFGNMASRVQGDVYFTGVHEIIALTNLLFFITCKDRCCPSKP